MRAALLLAGSITTAAAGVAYSTFDVKPQNLPEMVMRSGRAFYAGVMITLDYKTLPNDKSDPTYKPLQKECHQRAADRLLEVCRENKGTYTKAGQYLASLQHVLPAEYTDTLAVLQDKAPFLPYDEVEQVILRELEISDVREAFEHINELPIAAASLAQVHEAVLFNGQRVAIKVQYPAVSRTFNMDLASLSLCARALGYLFPEFEYSWAMPEFRAYATEELDFRHEAKNNEHIANDFRADPQIVTPAVMHDMVTARLLVMEFIDGVKVNDIQGIRALGLSEDDVARLLLECFGDQMFSYSFLHSDPHPGNIFVRKVNGRAQLVLLDHGLYRVLDPAFSRSWAELWFALVVRDIPQVRRSCAELNAGEFAELLAMLLTFRPLSNKDKGLSGKVSKEEVRHMLKEVETHRSRFSEWMEQLPRDLLLVLRSTNILRAINWELTNGRVNRYYYTARSALKAIHKDDNWWSLRYWFNLFKLELSLFLFKWTMFAFALWHGSDLPSSKIQMHQTMKDGEVVNI